MKPQQWKHIRLGSRNQYKAYVWGDFRISHNKGNKPWGLNIEDCTVGLYRTLRIAKDVAEIIVAKEAE